MNIRLRNTCFYSCLLLILLFQGELSAQNFDLPVSLEVVEGQTISYSYGHVGNPAQTYIFNRTDNFGTSTGPFSQGGGNYVVQYSANSSANYGIDTVTLFLRKPPTGAMTYRQLFIKVVKSKVIAKDDFIETGINQSNTFSPTSNDYGNRGILNVTDVSMMNNGTATVSNNNIVFTPNAGFEGIANLNYVVCDDVGTCDKATVHICVGDPHSYNNDTMSILTIKNNSVPVFTPLSNYVLHTGPSHGGLVTTNGILRYEPNTNWTGDDDFIYQNVSTGQLKTIAVDVMDVDAPNTYVKDDLGHTFIGQPTEINLLDNDLFGAALYNVTITSNPQFGTLTYIAKGYYLYFPNAGFEGVDEFYYSASPNSNGSNAEIGKANIIVSDQRPASPKFELQTPINTPLVLDYNIPVDNFTFTINNNGANGNVSYYAGYIDTLINGYQVEGTNLLIYYPNNNYVGSDSIEVDYCVVGNSNCSTAKVVIDVQNIAGALHCVGLDCVWPGDGNMDGVVDLRDLLPTGWCIGDVGVQRNNAVINPWHGQESANWGVAFPHTKIDLKHLDANGDSIVNVSDTVAINNHYQKYHGLSPEPINFPSDIPLFLGAPDTIHVSGPGDIVTMPIILGDPNLPALDMYGLTFSIDFDPSVINAVESRITFDNESWVNYTSPALHMVKKPFEGRLDAGYTRTSGIASNGYGRIGSVDFIIIDDLDPFRTPEFIYARISGSMMNGAGNSMGSSESFLRIRLGGKDAKPDPNHLMLFPNPAFDFMSYRMVEGAEIIGDIEVFDLAGKKIVQQSHQELNGQIYTGNYVPGIYMMRIQTATGAVTKKFEVISGN